MYIQFRTLSNFALPRPSPPAPPPNLPRLQFLITCAKAKGECLWIFHTQPLATPWSYMMCSLDMFSTHDVVLDMFSTHDVVDARFIFKAGTEHYVQKV